MPLAVARTRARRSRGERPPEPRTHTEIQGKLRDIGLLEGFDVWVADRGTRVEWPACSVTAA